jgi:hypothetical protein
MKGKNFSKDVETDNIPIHRRRREEDASEDASEDATSTCDALYF